MKIAILTMFNGLSQTYSLVNVVSEHIKMLLDNNIDTTILVSETINDKEKWGVFLDNRLKWIKIKNTINNKQIKWYDYSNQNKKLHESFYDEVKVISEDFKQKLKPFDICIMHDILYQGWHYVHNVAIRKAQKELPNLKFISFIHSFPVKRPKEIKEELKYRYVDMPNTIFAYPTQSGIKALCLQYNIPKEKCVVINNSIPLIEFLSEEVNQLNQKTNFIDSEILIIYPARLTQSKKQEKVAALAGSLKKISGKSIKIIFCDFPSMDIDSKKYKEIIIKTGLTYGLNKEDIIFTTDYGYSFGFPRKSVLDLFSLSNVFICPSFSESFGLTVLEAASKGNIIILNKKVPALEELGKSINSYFMNWDAKNNGYNTYETYHPSEMQYYLDHAKIINQKLEDSIIKSKTKIRTRYSNNYIFKNQLLPILTKLYKNDFIS